MKIMFTLRRPLVIDSALGDEKAKVTILFDLLNMCKRHLKSAGDPKNKLNHLLVKP